MTVLNPMDSWGSQDILAGFEPADPRSNRGESVNIKNMQKKIRFLTGILAYCSKYQSRISIIKSIIAYQI
jgi:hypothetical protein